MPDNEKMQRVSKVNPCPICEKPDWCLVSPDKTAAICSRIEDGSKKRCGDAGWLHVLSNRHNRHNGHRKRCLTLPLAEKPMDFGQLSQQYQQQLPDEMLNWLSVKLGISTKSLKRLRVGWDGVAYTFPMSSAESQIIGIRRRFPNDQKVSLTGSKAGLFIPTDLSSENLLLICEGPTDTAAAIDLGFDAVGRPNCNSKVDMTTEIVKGRDVVIVGDNDDVGKAGVERLSDTLVLYCSSVKVIYPLDGIKDLRQWLRAGLTNGQLQQIIDEAKEVQIKIVVQV